MKREMSVSGTFYPNTPEEIKRYFNHFTKVYDEKFTLPALKPKAVIVPHAGYIYSGFSANIAYRVLKNSGIKNFVIIGPSHRVAFHGTSLCEFKAYKTPFGELQNAEELLHELKQKFDIGCFADAHYEHSTEVQFPFIKHYMENAKILEIIYGKADPHHISQIIDYLLTREDTGIIISTDLSHFYDLNMAHQLDGICIEAIKNLDLKEINEGCEACGITGVEAMMMSAKKAGLHTKILDYRTSADASGDENRVVGYLSSCFYETK
ncbi:AmmeMemoRadiSam system protein B [Sulfurimonas sp. HSL-1716]|uniref:AmmeMemoRadiSam system protein B n=1 Tax=Hydrocurvibacter sulfurireducens TaxID=3131937 RepID=UPI0031F9B72D